MSEITHESLMQDLESIGKSIDTLRDERDRLKAEKQTLLGVIEGWKKEESFQREQADLLKSQLAVAREGLEKIAGECIPDGQLQSMVFDLIAQLSDAGGKK